MENIVLILICMPCRSQLSVARKTVETPWSDQFNIKRVGIQTNKPLNWQHGGYTCIDFICLNRCFIPVATKEQFTKTLKCLARPYLRIETGDERPL